MNQFKYNSVSKLINNGYALVSCGKLDRALRIVHDFVEEIITEPLCVSQVFGSKSLDKLCQFIGHENLANINNSKILINHNSFDKTIYVYVVTKLQKSGGHTRVIEEFIKGKRDSQHIILSTELDGKSDLQYLDTVNSTLGEIYFEQAPKGSYQERLNWLQLRLIEIAPKRTYLFNHHQDCVAIAAAQPEMDLDFYFYHHGDHHLCLGIYISYFKHIDPHPMGYHHCRNKLKIENIYIPLTIEDKGSVENNNFDQLTTCTVGRSNKIEIPYFVSYLDLVPEIIKATSGRHVHIGRLTPWARYRIKRGLKKLDIDTSRFIYIPWVPSVWKALHKFKVNLYIASFPYGGGLTLVEAMGAGVPVVLHRHIFSRILSCIELAYPEAFSWRQPEELLQHCNTLTPDGLKNEGYISRLHFEKYHSSLHLENFLNNSEFSNLKPCSLSEKFSLEADEWGLWMARQLSFNRLVLRAVYRALKKLRAVCH